MRTFKGLKSKLASQEAKDPVFSHDGTFLATLANGFTCISIEAVSDRLRIVVPNLDFKDYRVTRLFSINLR